MKAGIGERLRELVGPAHCVEGAAIDARYGRDLWGSDRVGQPRFVVKPGSVEQVSAVLRACHEAYQPVVPQGGMTGLVSGGVPGPDEVVLSLERLDRIEDIDPVGRTMTVEAGATLQRVQDCAAGHGLLFPLDIAPRQECTIGGNVSTNAGGLRVLLYGMVRELVLGVEAVLADGTVVNGLHRLVKNNAGYDLKHLFIGTEGTLGVVTRATLRLRPAPTVRLAAFCGVPDLAAALELLHRLQALLPGMVSAYEAMWDSAYEVVVPLRDELPLPLAGRYPLYVLVECSGADAEGDPARFDAALARCAGLIREYRVGRTPEEVGRLWAVRERIPKVVLARQPLFGFDLSLPAGELEGYLAEVEMELRGYWPAVRLVVFGHLGDDNVHIAVLTGERTRERKPLVEEIVYRHIARHRGSISAEHGIGFEKLPYLGYSRTAEEVNLMRRLKRMLDPHGVLNPGRVFTDEAQPMPRLELAGEVAG
jgi:FAD/FMN-containing dehydrogenase